MSDVLDNPIKAEKRKKLHVLREKGINPYPYTFDQSIHVEKLIADYSNLASGEKKLETNFKIAGRLMTKREMGKASFFNSICDEQKKARLFWAIIQALRHINTNFNVEITRLT